MKFLIETGYPKTKIFERPAPVFEPGWWGNAPYFKMSAPYEDNVGRQHMNLSVQTGTMADTRAQGHTIGKCHNPAGYRVIEKSRLEELERKECELAELKRLTADGHRER